MGKLTQVQFETWAVFEEIQYLVIYNHIPWLSNLTFHSLLKILFRKFSHKDTAPTHLDK